MQQNKCNKRDVSNVMREQQRKKSIPSDVDGSYTGMTIDGEIPVQDADDL